MTHFFIAFETVLPLFLIILAGMAFPRFNSKSELWVDVLNKYAYWIGFPALIIYSLLELEIGGGTLGSVTIVNSIFLVGSLVLVFPISKIFRLSVQLKRTLFIIIPFGNVSYLGIPVLFNAYGASILPHAALISAVYVFWLLTLCIILIELYGTDQTNFRKLLISLAKNQLLISVLVGLIIVIFQIKLPSFIETTIKLFSDSVTAVVLFSLGIFLGLQKRGNAKDWLLVGLICVVTMILLPSVFFGMLSYWEIETNTLRATIIDASMPLGVTPYLIAEHYKLKTTLVARVIVLGTLLSMLIIPLWMVVLG